MKVFAFDLLPFDAICMNEHHSKPYGLMPSVRLAEELPLYELGFDLTQEQGMTFVGDPDTVTRAIKAHMKELGAGVLMGLFQFGSLPHALARKNIELFAREVLPELKRA